ncbi:MAG: hypothetical protein AMS27_00205 [Bacteroides sp. SM23_62_1]|nr:MAG: hypothetical protein AMS27_00205 [Bacteroides sp. SM23_62_1]
MKLRIIILLNIFISIDPVFSQDTLKIPMDGQDSLFMRMKILESEVQKLQQELKNLQEEDEIKKLLEEAEKLSIQPEEEKLDISKRYYSGARQQQGLNPNISFGVDFFAGLSTYDKTDYNTPGEIIYGNNGFFLREAQLSFIAPLDPFTRGKGFFATSGTGVDVDEVYLEWLNLPLNMNLKAGFFRPEFGFLNRYHDHALPQFDRPKGLINLFGKEGLAGAGLASIIMLPKFLFSDATSIELSALMGDNNQSFTNKKVGEFIFTGQLLNYYDLSPSSYIELRLSSAGGKNDQPGGNYSSYVTGAGITFKWAPVGREKYRTIDWKNEFLYSFHGYVDGYYRSMGFYSSIQNKLGARFWLNGRIGYSEIPYDPSQFEWDFTVCLDFWESEFVFTRFQYQYNYRETGIRKDLTGPFPNDHLFIIQVVWAMGPHKHEAY